MSRSDKSPQGDRLPAHRKGNHQRDGPTRHAAGRTYGTMSAPFRFNLRESRIPMPRKKTMKQVRKALLNHDLVQLPQKLKRADLVEGYVVAIGTRWVVLAITTNGGPDGWSVVRRADIRGVWEAGGERFTRRIYELDGCWPPVPPEVPLSLDGTVQELIESAAAAFPLVVMYVDDENYSQIGRPVRWTSKWLTGETWTETRSGCRPCTATGSPTSSASTSVATTSLRSPVSPSSLPSQFDRTTNTSAARPRVPLVDRLPVHRKRKVYRECCSGGPSTG